MAYRWKPSASQRRAFAERMKDPNEKAAYEARKVARVEKRRASSQFDYETAGGQYVPTREQYDYCMQNMHLADTPAVENAFNSVIYGFTCREKVPHDHIHMVNELRRQYGQ